MGIRLVLLAVLSHLLGDFVFQNDKLKSMRFPYELLPTTKNSLNLDFYMKHKLYLVSSYLEKKNPYHSLEQNRISLNNAIHSALIDCFNLPLSIHFILIHTLKGNIIHVIIHGVLFGSIIKLVQLIAHLPIIQPGLTLTILAFMCFHFFIDESKSILALRHPSWNETLFFFIIDQASHILSFLLLPYFTFQPAFTIKFNSLTLLISQLLQEKVLLIAITFLLMTFFAGIFIKISMEHINQIQTPRDTPASAEINHGGLLIGILERVLILVSFLFSYPQLMGYILTAKSIARLKKLDDARFAEYFLVGNLLSFLFGIVGSIIICHLVKGI